MKQESLKAVKHKEVPIAGHNGSFIVLYGERIKDMEMQEASIEVTVDLMYLKTEETRRVRRGPSIHSNTH